LENCAAVYDFYERYDANPRRARIAHQLIGTAYRPKVSFLDNQTAHLVHDAVSSADVTILACKHVNMNDPLHLVALVGIIDTFDGFAGRTVIPSKRSLFSMKIRHWIDDLGAIPTFRRKDFLNSSGVLDELSHEELSNATERLINTCVAQMSRGKHLAIFPESERSARLEGADPSRVNSLKEGIAKIYLKACESVSIAIVPLGLCYDQTSSLRANFTPSMVVGAPLTGVYTDTTQLMEDLAVAMQAAQTAAFERANLSYSVPLCDSK
jgi:1-acyl-sn-glycerol-3-phosphate acyltransferase